MTGRDRMVLIVLSTLAVLVAAWLLAVSPERQKAARMGAEVSSAQAKLQSAESQLASAAAAQTHYRAAYAAVVNLGKAVPADQQVPALIYELAQASGQKNVEFASITTGSAPGATGATGGATSGAAGSGAPGSSSAAGAAASAGFQQMPFTFVFNGGFSNLYSLFNQLDGFAQRTSAGQLLVSGRLLTVQSVKLAPATSSETGSSAGSGSAKPSEQLTGTITATAYVLPAGETLTGGATSAGPAGTATPAASTAASSPSTTPAVIQVHP
jgi:hypothetical protein